MAQEPVQNYGNHARKLPRLYLLAALVLALNLGWSISRLIRDPSRDTTLGLLMTVSLFVLFYYSRTFSLTVQDRVIRLEERLRMERLLPADLQGRIGLFTPRQYVAMRFASDAELPELARRVLDENLADPAAIKKLIKNWRADWLRA